MQSTPMFDVEALRRGIEEGDASALRSLYAQDAHMTVVDQRDQPSHPHEIDGASEIGAFFDEILARGDLRHHLERVVVSADGGHVAYLEECQYPDGARVLSSSMLDLRDGRIVSQTSLQTWDEQGAADPHAEQHAHEHPGASGVMTSGLMTSTAAESAATGGGAAEGGATEGRATESSVMESGSGAGRVMESSPGHSGVMDAGTATPRGAGAAGAATGAASGFEHLDFGRPDETRTFAHGRAEIIRTTDGRVIGRYLLEPGWRWSRDVRPLAGTELCEASHFQYQLSGTVRVRMADGTEFDSRAGEVTQLPAGHDAWVVGDEQAVVVDWQGALHYAEGTRQDR